jgi:hypothetical protein
MPTDEIHRLRSNGTFFIKPYGAELAKLQISSKPISNQDFCLRALAFTCDLGSDIGNARRTAIGLALHPRVGQESPLGVVGDNVLCVIAQMI